MKKVLAIIFIISMLVTIFSACSNELSDVNEATAENELSDVNEATAEVEVLDEYELAAEDLISAIRGNLKNPYSLIVNDIICYELNDNVIEFVKSNNIDVLFDDSWSYSKYVFAVDFSAENSLGGMGRETHYYYYSSVGIEEDEEAYLLIKWFELEFEDQYRAIDLSKLVY